MMPVFSWLQSVEWMRFERKSDASTCLQRYYYVSPIVIRTCPAS